MNIEEKGRTKLYTLNKTYRKKKHGKKKFEKIQEKMKTYEDINDSISVTLVLKSI